MLLCRRILAAIVAVFLVLGAPADAQDEGTIGIGLLEAPADQADDPRARLYVVDQLVPGDVIERRLQVTNTTAEAVTVDLYAAASSIEDGQWKPLDGRAENPLSSWTSVTPAQVEVPSGGAAEATLRVEVPDDAPGGEQYAVVWAQPPAATSGGVTVVNRVGVRMYVHIGAEAVGTDFAIGAASAVTAPGGERSLAVDVDNVGGRAVDLTGSLELTDGPGSSTAGPFEVPAATTLAPGSSGTVTIPVPAELPAGPWTAEVTLRSGTEERTATIEVTWPEPGEEAEAPVEPSSDEGEDGGIDPGEAALTAVAALIVVALIVALSVYLRRRRSLTA